MGEDRSGRCRFRDDLAGVIGDHHPSADGSSPETLFESLSRLERRALIGGASDRTLGDIAEARFLAGILREAVRPPRPAPLRAVLRAVGRSAARGRTGAGADPV